MWIARWVIAVGLLCSLAYADAKRVVVAGNKAWTDSGMKVRRGDKLTITSVGMIQSGGRQYGIGGATGSRRLDDIEAVFPLATAQPMALILRIDRGPAFVPDVDGAFTAATDGTLFLGPNDDQLADNQGAWTVTISSGDGRGAVDESIDGAHPLAYSMWSHCAGTGTTDAVFLGDGGVEIADVDCRGARWALDGTRVSFACGAAKYVATLDGDKLDGAWTAGARKGVVCMRRMDPSSNPNVTKVDPSKQVGKKRPGSRGSSSKNQRIGSKTARDDNKPRTWCPAGEHLYQNGCYTCPSGFQWQGNGMCLENCPAGWLTWKDQCVKCPAGTTWNRNGSCYSWRITKPGDDS